MTMRTHTRLQCSCGHRGSIVESENDQPYSKEWYSVGVRDLETRGTYTGPGQAVYRDATILSVLWFTPHARPHR